MVHSVGKKLQQSRLSKQLSIEEAARVTRIRPDKLLDLEDDNYSNFPSMSYAKGFLLLYARFLGVDVREFADSLHAPNPVSSDDYEYLNAASEGAQPPPSRRPYHFAPRRQKTILPVIVFGVLAGAIVLSIYLVVNFERIGNLDDVADKKDLSSPAASPAISTLPAAPVAEPAAPVAVAVATPIPVPVAVAVPVAPGLRTAPPAVAVAPAVPVAPASGQPAPPTAQAVPAASAATLTPVPPPAPPSTFDPSREVRRAEPVFATPPAHAAAAPNALPPVATGPVIAATVPAATPMPVQAAEAVEAPAAVASPDAVPEAVKQVSIMPIRKTMVTIRKDVADSAPIFEDWLYPGAGPLKVSGHKLWIQVQDPSAVQITQDGQPLPSGQADIQIE